MRPGRAADRSPPSGAAVTVNVVVEFNIRISLKFYFVQIHLWLYVLLFFFLLFLFFSLMCLFFAFFLPSFSSLFLLNSSLILVLPFFITQFPFCDYESTTVHIFLHNFTC